MEDSFAKKWLPALATLMVALIAASFSYVQTKNNIRDNDRARTEAQEETKRARLEAQAKEEHEWGLKVIDMYFAKRELFDLYSLLA
jgi:hypothetical protein